MQIENIMLAGADVLDSFKRPNGFHILLQYNNREEAGRVFNELSDQGEVIMPLQKVFWSPCYGVLRDKFDIPREINYSA